MITPFTIGTESLLQNIREKEHLQDKEKDNQLGYDNDPELFPKGHAPEAIVIEIKNPSCKISHRTQQE